MSKQYDNTNRGALFKNDRREKDTHPEYNGSINVDGQEFWLSAWIKEGSKGKFFSLSVKPKDEQRGGGHGGSRGGAPQRQRPAPATQQPADDFADDDIPFIRQRGDF